MREPQAGEFWTVPRIPGQVYLLSAPEPPREGEAHVMVAAVYPKDMRTLPQTREDVLLLPAETGLEIPVWVALWNTRPLFARELGRRVGRAMEAWQQQLHDWYWMPMVEGTAIPEHPRLGRERFLPWTRRRIAKFRESEMEHWSALSGAVLTQLLIRESPGEAPPGPPVDPR